MKEFTPFFNLCRELDAGKTLWVQGAGGNMSIKKDSTLYVKPSGKRISQIFNSTELSRIKTSSMTQKLLELFRNASAHNLELEYKSAIEQSTIEGSLRPSMESGFHGWLKGEYVFHFHSVAAIGLAELANKKNTDNSLLFNQWYRDHWQKVLGKYTIIEACLPGWELTHLIAETREECSIYFLKNHGVILNFNSLEMISQYRSFEAEAMKIFNPMGYSSFQQWYGKEAFELIELAPELLTAPLKFFFPDMAIMYPYMSKFLKPNDDNTLTFDYKNVIKGTNDQDALENWLAHSMILQLWPQLPELSSQLTQAIPQLPTEVARKKIIEEKK